MTLNSSAKRLPPFKYFSQDLIPDHEEWWHCFLDKESDAIVLRRRENLVDFFDDNSAGYRLCFMRLKPGVKTNFKAFYNVVLKSLVKHYGT